MSEIPGISNQRPQRPSFVDRAAEYAKGQALNEKGIQLIRDVAGLMGADRSFRVTNTSSAASSGEVGTMRTTGNPVIDQPDSAKAKQADLTKLMLYLKMEGEKQQLTLAQEKIQLMQGEMDVRHTEQREALQKSLEEMDKAARMSIFMKVFGWLMAAVAVAFAVVSCIATGGAAVGAIVGAVMAIGMAAANQTGAINDLTELIAEGLKNKGMDERTAQILAAVIMAVAMILVTVGTGWGADKIASGIGRAIASSASAAGGAAAGAGSAVVGAAVQGGSSLFSASTMATAKAVLGWMKLGMFGAGMMGTAFGGIASFLGYQAGMSQADLSEMEKFLAMMRQRLEEGEEELNEILDMIQNSVAAIIEVLDNATDTELEIASKLGTMV